MQQLTLDDDILKCELRDMMNTVRIAIIIRRLTRMNLFDDECFAAAADSDLTYICIQVKEGSLQQMTAGDAVI